MENEKLEHQKRKEVLNKILSELSSKEPDLYYKATIEIAELIKEALNKEELDLTGEQIDLMSNLSANDLQVLMSHHEGPGAI